MTDPYPKLPGDYAVHAVAYDGQVRAVAVGATDTVQELARIHGLSPVATAALGRLSIGALLLARDLEDGESLTAIVRGDGPLGTLTAVARADGTVRSLLTHPDVPATYLAPGKLNVGAAVGAGTLTVIRERTGRSPQTGIVDLISGEIAEDLTYYLATSEQIPSIVALGVRLSGRVTEAAGLLVQLLPGATEATIDRLEARVAGFPELTHLMAEGFGPAQLIDLLLGDPEIRYLETEPVGYRCTCSRDGMARSLMALPVSDRQDLARSPEGLSITCDFCRTQYHFTQPEVRDLLADGPAAD